MSQVSHFFERVTPSFVRESSRSVMDFEGYAYEYECSLSYCYNIGRSIKSALRAVRDQQQTENSLKNCYEVSYRVRYEYEYVLVVFNIINHQSSSSTRNRSSVRSTSRSTVRNPFPSRPLQYTITSIVRIDEQTKRSSDVSLWYAWHDRKLRFLLLH